MVKVLPRPHWLLTSMEPPISRMSLRQMDSPRPVPLVFARQAGVDLPKWLEQSFQIFRPDADSGVGNRNRVRIASFCRKQSARSPHP